jgi:hypothetical protein
MSQSFEPLRCPYCPRIIHTLDEWHTHLQSHWNDNQSETPGEVPGASDAGVLAREPAPDPDPSIQYGNHENQAEYLRCCDLLAHANTEIETLRRQVASLWDELSELREIAHVQPPPVPLPQGRRSLRVITEDPQGDPSTGAA